MSKGSAHAARGDGAFTLLEAVLAVALLSAVAIVCVGLRTQGLASARRVGERHALQRDEQAIFDMLTGGLLPPAENGEEGVRRWRGELLGAPYELEARRIAVENPVRRGARKDLASLSESIPMWRYTLKRAGRETEFVWHR